MGILQTKTRLLLWFKISPWVSGAILNWGPGAKQSLPPALLLHCLHYQMTTADWNVTWYQAWGKQKGKLCKSAWQLWKGGQGSEELNSSNLGKGGRGQKETEENSWLLNEELPWHKLQKALLWGVNPATGISPTVWKPCSERGLSPYSWEPFFLVVTQMPPANTDTQRPTQADPGTGPWVINGTHNRNAFKGRNTEIQQVLINSMTGNVSAFMCKVTLFMKSHLRTLLKKILPFLHTK